MQKKVLKEAVIFFLLLIPMALIIHPDLLSTPAHRFSLMIERENYFHPFLYLLLVYAILGVIRLLFQASKKLFLLFKKS